MELHTRLKATISLVIKLYEHSKFLLRNLLFFELDY